jgi:hypothetical protein
MSMTEMFFGLGYMLGNAGKADLRGREDLTYKHLLDESELTI